MKPISLQTIVLIVVSAIALNSMPSQAMLPPQMLRAVCGAFADAEEVVGNKAMAAGKAAVSMAMKPIAVVGGLKTAAVGTGMKIGGGAIKFVGSKMAKDGAILEASGAGLKGAGLGVAALGVKPLAEKVVIAGKGAEGTIDAANKVAEKFSHAVGDTSVQIAATLDSPLVGHHHKEVNMSAGMGAENNVAANEIQQQQLEQLDLQQSEHQVTKRAAKIDGEVAKAAINLVKEAKMEECVARTICDLNCNPQGFGQDGKQVFMNMVRLQGAKVLDEADTKYFQDAASKGRSATGDCEKCATHFSKCTSKSTDLIKMASHIRID